MAKIESADVRSVAFVGHGTAGKTILTEACLLHAKAIKRLGSIQDGSTVTDHDEHEREVKHSIDVGLACCEYRGKRLHLVDTPGYPDYIGEAISGMSAADLALVVVCAQDGVRVNTHEMWRRAEQLGLPRAIAISRLDLEHARWAERLEQIRAAFGERCVPLTVPKDGAAGSGFAGVERVWPLAAGASAAAREAAKALLERAVETDDELMMRYLEGEELSPEEVGPALHRAIASGHVVPVFATAAEKGAGIPELMDAVVELFPRPDERTFQALDAETGEPVEIKADAPFTARVFKVSYDPFLGKVGYLRVCSGSVSAGSSVLHPPSGSNLKLGHLYFIFGKEQRETEEAVAGDLVAVSKIEALGLGDALCTADLRVNWPPLSYPEPMVGVAVEPKTRADDAKILEALNKLAGSDPTLKVERVKQTKELVVTGMSNLHLETVFHRLKSRYQVEVETRLPKVPYLETITGKAAADYRHKKQTGGAGQFAHVYLRVEPLPRGGGFEFHNEVVGGAISQNFMPSIEKGIKQIMEEGILAGFQVVDVRVTVYDGKEHPVDSKDIAFQIAGRNAFKEAVLAARPVLLEPIADVEIHAPQDFTGAIMGDLNTRRGRIQATESHGDRVVVKAKVPVAEMQTYSTELRSMTGGEGWYTMAHSHYDVVPKHIADQVIARYARQREEEK
ncbi:MAG: elongation factor G [Planctomycetota bacterium]|nr:MAG: elongation factor G [Planctomycetota bacterium]